MGISGRGCNSSSLRHRSPAVPAKEGAACTFGGKPRRPSLTRGEGGLSQQIGVFPKDGVASSGPNGGAYRTSDRPYSAKWPFHPVTNRHHKASGCSSPASPPQPSSPSPAAQGPQSLSLLSSCTAAKDDNPRESITSTSRAPPSLAVCTPPSADRREGTPSAAREEAWPSQLLPPSPSSRDGAPLG